MRAGTHVELPVKCCKNPDFNQNLNTSMHFVKKKHPAPNFMNFNSLLQGLRSCGMSPGRQVARATKSGTLAPNISGTTVWNLLHFTLVSPRILTCSQNS